MTHTKEPKYLVTGIKLYEISSPEGVIRTAANKTVKELSAVNRNKIVDDIEQYRRLQQLKYSRDLGCEIEVDVFYTENLYKKPSKQTGDV